MALGDEGRAALGQADGDYAAHLDHAVRTGTYCAYAPDPRTAMTWDVW